MATKENVQRQIMALREGIAKLAGLLANQGCTVIYQGSRCCTDGTTIYLPAVELLEGSTATGDEVLELVRNFTGYVYHEVSHILFTSWPEWRARFTKLTPQERGLTNAIEDCFVERRMCEVWRGAGDILESTHRYIVAQNRAAYARLDSMGQLTMLVSFLGRGEQQYSWARECFAPSVVSWVDEHLSEEIRSIGDITMTGESIDLAQRIYAKIKDQVEQEQQQPQQKQTQKQERKESQESESGAGESGETADKGEGEQGGVGPLDDPESVTDTDYDEPEELGETLAQAYRSLTEQVKRDVAYAPYTRQGDVYAAIEDDGTHSIDDDDLAETLCWLESLTVQVVGPLRAALARVLKARATAYQVRDMASGKLDRRRLWKVPMSQELPTPPRVRSQTVQQESFDELSVILCVNESGSMKESLSVAGHSITCVDMACVATLALGDVLHALGIRFAVCGHTTRGFSAGKMRYSQALQSDRDRFARWGDHLVSWVKTFDQDWRPRRRYVAAMDALANTYDAETLRYMASTLAKEPSDRRVIMMLDDGNPFPNVHSLATRHVIELKRAVAEVTQSGIECVGVGMGSDSVKHFYRDHIIVKRLELLPDQMLAKFGELLGLYRKGA